jgi:cytochrome c oxidase subunit III
LSEAFIGQGPPPPTEHGWGCDPVPEGPGAAGSSRRASFILVFLLLVASTVVFLAFTAAMLMRREISSDWVSLHKPGILWLNTGILLASSVAIERARRKLHAGDRTFFNRWWTLGTVLGALFLLGQALAWRQLREAGFYVAYSPSVAFFYILTASHAAHLVGGLTALIYVDVQALQFSLGPAKRTAIDCSAIFWHFLDVLWIYLMVLLYVWG